MLVKFNQPIFVVIIIIVITTIPVIIIIMQQVAARKVNLFVEKVANQVN